MTSIDIFAEASIRSRRPAILVTRLRYLGDVIISTSLLELLGERYPDVDIYYLTEKPYAAVLENNPHLAGIISVGDGHGDIFSAIRKTRRLGIVAVIDLFYNPKSAWISWLSGAPVRIGGSRKWRKKFYTYNFNVPSGVKSAILHNMYSLKPLGIEPEDRMPRIYIKQEELEDARATIESVAGKRDGFVAVHPGGKWQSKRWKSESFIELVHMIKKELKLDVLIISGPGEENISRDIKDATRGESHLLPVMDIRKVAAVIASCNALVANDGGIMHLSVALKVPTVGIIGPTDPEIWFPYKGKGPYSYVYLNKACSPCDKHFCNDRSCMDDLEPALVLKELKDILYAENAQ